MISLDVGFILLITFLIFFGISWRLLAQPVRITLDQWIEEIRLEQLTSVEAYNQAEEQYQSIKKQLVQVNKEIKILHQRAHEDLLKLQQQAQQDLKKLLYSKNQAHTSRLEEIYREKRAFLERIAFEEALSLFKEDISKASPKTLEVFHDQKLLQLEKYVYDNNFDQAPSEAS